VTFEIDANGIMNVAAIDKGTGKQQNVRVVASSGLSKDQVDKLVNDAEKFKDSDKKRRELAELKNSADALLYTSERAATECADLVPAPVIEQVKTDIAALRGLLGGSEDTGAIREALQRLEVSAYKIAESMYGSTNSETG
jgi:molecular chaperone DnaK